MAILTTLLPHFVKVRDSLLVFCDQVPAMLAVCDRSGRLLHMNPQLLRLVETDAGGTIAARIQHAAASLAAGRPGAERESARSRVRTTASWIGPDEPGAGGYIAVVVEAEVPSSDPASLLQERYELTSREAEIALLIASGLSAKAVAKELSISWHTARRHTERILRKVGVTRRAGVAAAISELKISIPANRNV
jgi:DNA-binding NarL/FixJ family response regulator